MALGLLINIIRTYKNWYDVFLDHKGIFPIYKEKIYYLRNGIKMITRCQTTDLGTMHTCFIGKENDTFLERLRNNPIIIDVGGHIGIFSIHVAKKIPNAKIYTYEPFPDNYELLIKNLKLNSVTNRIKPFCLAIFNKGGKKNLYFKKRYSAGCTLIKGKYATVDSIKVNCITIKDVFDSNKIKQCDLLKIDCEGADYEIIKSIPKSYFKRINFIHVEFHTEEEVKKIKNLLEKNGFSVQIKWATAEYGNVYGENIDKYTSNFMK